jgi:hypothetical protein
MFMWPRTATDNEESLVPNRNLLGELPDPIGALTLDDWASVLSDRLIIVTPGCLVFEPWLDNVTNLVLDQTGHAPVVVVMPGGALGLYPRGGRRRAHHESRHPLPRLRGSLRWSVAAP